MALPSTDYSRDLQERWSSNSTIRFVRPLYHSDKRHEGSLYIIACLRVGVPAISFTVMGNATPAPGDGLPEGIGSKCGQQ